MPGPDDERTLARARSGDPSTAKSTEDLSGILGISNFSILRAALAEYIAAHQGLSEGLGSLTLLHGTLGPQAILSLQERLDRDVEGLDKRVESTRLNRQEIKDPFEYQVACLLVTMFDFPGGGKTAREDVRRLLERLDKFTKEKKIEVKVQIEKKDLLTKGQLTSAMITTMVALSYDDSAIAQLDDPYILGKMGVIIDTRVRDEIHDFTPVQNLLSILRGLRHEESAAVLENWVYEQLGANPEECIGFLRVLAQFSSFLDRDSFVKLYAAGGGRINLLPFQSFYQAVNKAVAHLRRLNDPEMEPYINSLQGVEQLITRKFFQIIKGPHKDAVSAAAAEALTPSIRDLSEDFIKRVTAKAETGKIIEQELAYEALMMLEQSGVDTGGISTFCRMVADQEPEVGKEVEKQAVKLGLIKSDGEIRREIFTEALQALEIPWKDAREVDFAVGWGTKKVGDVEIKEKEEDQIIKPGARFLEVYYISGTFGPFCRGHYDFVRRVEEYIKTKEASEKTKDTQRIILIAPITKVRGIPEYEKDPGRIGTIKQRVASILIQAAELDRKRVFITTSLQPDPAEAGNVDVSISQTISNFIQKINKDFEARRATNFLTVKPPIVCVGADEFQWKEGTEGAKLAPQQPAKLTGRPSLVVGRYGRLLDLVDNGQELALTGAEDVILNPGTPMTHSSEAIRGIQEGDYSRFLLPAVPYVDKYWNPRAIEWRKKNIRPEVIKKKPPSVSTIYWQVIDEYQKLIRSEL